MAVRKLITIDEEKCDGCGLCATACHEGAIQIIGGKAKLISESYCDGLGDCIGECPQDAITIEEREAAPYDQAAVDAHLAARGSGTAAPAGAPPRSGGGCPGAAVHNLESEAGAAARAGYGRPSRLGHWPVQINLVPPNAPFLAGADILVAADCVPCATANFHDDYLAGKALLIGCPKFDDVQHYIEKLKAMFEQSRPRSITVVRMVVPCCGGLANLVMRARSESVPHVPMSVVTVGIDGEELAVEESPAVV